MAYVTLAALKSALRITDTVDDTVLQLALDAASGLVDDHCMRTFTVTPSVETRLFSPLGGRVSTDDVPTVTGLIVSTGGTAVPLEVEGVSGGYRLEPRNAVALGEPFTSLVIKGGWPSPSFYGFSNTVSITARWGYSLVVPATVIQATQLQASRLFSRRQSPYGVTGSPDLGGELRLLAKVDPDVAVLLSKFVKYEIL